MRATGSSPRPRWIDSDSSCASRRTTSFPFASFAIVSMATSFGGDAPRGTEFLFNRNRLNVAISRAKCLAIVVCGERLMSVPTPSLKDLPRLNLLAHAEAISAA